MVGMVEIEDARRRTEEKEGAAFDLKGFHDRLLALGQLPLQALRRELGWLEPPTHAGLRARSRR